MKITDIKESGSNNILLWALENNADVKTDYQLQSIVNNELFYLVTFHNVNLFELFRLSQMYREKLYIIKEYQFSIPSSKDLNFMFNGFVCLNENNPEEKTPLCAVAEHVMNMFINLTKQMKNDDDIISSGALRLFLPMLTRKFDVQIPVSFIDLISSLNEEESSNIFKAEYPSTLKSIIESDNNFLNVLKMGFVKGTAIIKYNKRYDQYLEITKYQSLKKVKGTKLYRFNILSLFKFDKVVHGECRVSFFRAKTDSIEFKKSIQKLATINSPLKIDFIIELPIEYMNLLMNSYSREDLPVQYESSISSILDSGLVYDDFITPEYNEDEEIGEEVQNKLNEIKAYRLRIEECNDILINSLPMFIENEGEIDITSVFAMLPSLYKTKAVITLDFSKINLFTNHYDSLLSTMFKEMIEIGSNLYKEITAMK